MRASKNFCTSCEESATERSHAATAASGTLPNELFPHQLLGKNIQVDITKRIVLGGYLP